MNLNKGTTIKRAIVITVATLGIAFAGIMFIWPFLSVDSFSKSKKILIESSKNNDLNSAIGGLGIILRLQNGDWIAIRYQDSHAGTIVSKAVAMTSDGRFMKSSKHYCGSLAGYRYREKIIEDYKTLLTETPDEQMKNEIIAEIDEVQEITQKMHLAQVENQPNLDSAISKLEEFGFRLWK